MSYNRSRSSIRDILHNNNNTNHHHNISQPRQPSTLNSPSSYSSSTTDEDDNKTSLILYKKRWLMLFLISSLNILSDWTCFSVAPIATLTSSSLPYVNPTLLVVIFLFSNGISTYFEPSILGLLGLRRTIVLGSVLLTIGNLVKSWTTQTIRIYMGFFLVGLSQPLYQCTPAILSSSWFPDKERTLATGVALNSNQLGIGCAFFFGTYFVHSTDELREYFTALGIMSLILCVLVILMFENAPPTPPSETARVLKGTIKWPYWRGDAPDDASHITNTPNFATPLDFFATPTPTYARSAFDSSSVVTVSFSQISNAYFSPAAENAPDNQPLHRRPGFLHSLIAFSISTVIINTISASMDYILNQANVGLIGALFQLIIMMSSLTFGRYTDHSRAYYTVLLVLLLFGAFAMAACGLGYHLTTSLFLVAVSIGPIIPISAEMGCEISYPLCQNAVLVLFQFVANISSALFLPLFDALRKWGQVDYQRSWELLILIHAIVTVYFSTFRGRYRRLEIEKGGEEEPLLKKDKV